MTTTEIGIFRAYEYSYVMFLTLCGRILITVLFPVASKYRSKEIIFRRINKTIPFLSIIGYPSTIGLGSIILLFYGSEYTFNLKLVLMFGIVGIVMFFDTAYGWLMNSVGKKGIRITSFAALTMAIVNIILNFLLIPILGIEGAVIALIISYILSASIVLSKRKYFYDTSMAY
jgi:O-antigen/teichoic acid export membrane protein